MNQKVTIQSDAGDVTVEVVVYDSRMIDSVVKDDKTIELRVPAGMDEKLIEQYIRNNKKGLLKKYEEAMWKNWEVEPTWDIIDGKTQYKSGVVLPFLGKSELILRIKKTLLKKGTKIYPKKHNDGKQYLIIETDNIEQDFLRYCIKNYYKKCTMALIDLRLERLAQIMGLEYEGVRITNCGPDPKFHYARLAYKNLEIDDQPTVWGSCTRSKMLKFDWKISMLPMEIVEYIFVHELGHLKKMNHSGAFWDEIGKVMPNYQMCKTWLEAHGKEYEIY